MYEPLLSHRGYGELVLACAEGVSPAYKSACGRYVPDLHGRPAVATSGMGWNEPVPHQPASAIDP